MLQTCLQGEMKEKGNNVILALSLESYVGV